MPRKKLIAKLDAQQVEYLASIGCTDEEIAVLAGMSERTMQLRFNAQLKTGRAQLRVNIRKAQLLAAERGNAAVLIWLGKQYLGQREAVPTVTAQRALVVELTDHVMGDDTRASDKQSDND